MGNEFKDIDWSKPVRHRDTHEKVQRLFVEDGKGGYKPLTYWKNGEELEYICYPKPSEVPGFIITAVDCYGRLRGFPGRGLIENAPETVTIYLYRRPRSLPMPTTLKLSAAEQDKYGYTLVKEIETEL